MNIEMTRDGLGFKYYVTRDGVLLASGWIRCETYARAHEIITQLGGAL